MNEQTKGKIESLLKENKIILFMKGEPNYPMCGFSAKVVDVLNDAGISFNYFNILEDGEIRDELLQVRSSLADAINSMTRSNCRSETTGPTSLPSCQGIPIGRASACRTNSAVTAS